MVFTSDKFHGAYTREDNKERGKAQRKERNARKRGEKR